MSRLLIFIFMVSVIHIQAKDKTDAMLFGDVKSKQTGEHIPFVKISIKGTKLGTVTDKSGHFKLPNLPIGKNTIVTHSIGYKPSEHIVDMEKDKAVELFIELEDDLLQLDMIVVTGTRTQHLIKDVPVRTEIITKNEIESKNASNVYQALDGTPGVRVENQCQSCNFTMVRMQGLGSEHTQLLINGQPVYSGLASVYGLQQMSTVDIEQIEIIKGAGSALYGSSAVAGAINIVTKEPSFEPITSILVQLGNYNTNTFQLSSSLRNEKGDIGLNIFAQKMTEDAIDETGEGFISKIVNQKDGVSDRVATDLVNAGFGLFIDGAVFYEDQLILRGKSIVEKRQGGIMTDDYYKNPFTDGTENITTNRYETQLNYIIPIGTSSGFNFSFSYVIHNRDATNDSYLNDYLKTHENNTPDIREMRPYLASENTFTSTLTFNTSIDDHNLICGIQYFYDNVEESGMYVVVDPNSQYLGESYRSIGNKFANEFGFFIQDEWVITDKLTLVPGFRIDNHNSGEEYNSDKQIFETSTFPHTSFEESNINPRLAVKYEITPDFILRFNTGTGFRAPYGFSEDLHLCSGSPRVWKSSDLKPETSISYNFSTDYYGNKFRISANIFRTDLKDKIGFTDADPNITALGYDYQWKNIDDAFVQGIELTFIYNMIRTLDFGLDFTYNNGEYKNPRLDWINTEFENDSKYIARFPLITGNAKVEFRPNSWIFTLTGSLQGTMYIDYFSSLENPAPGFGSKIKKTDPFMTFNFKASKDFKNFKLFTGINNIFNYLQDEKHIDDAAFLYAPVYGTIFYAGIAIDISH